MLLLGERWFGETGKHRRLPLFSGRRGRRHRLPFNPKGNANCICCKNSVSRSDGVLHRAEHMTSRAAALDMAGDGRPDMGSTAPGRAYNISGPRGV